MPSDREKWDERYRASGYVMGMEPSAYLAENIDTLRRMAPGHIALDVACGEGRNSSALAAAGFDVIGVDSSGVALEKARARALREGFAIDFRQLDLVTEKLPPGPFDVIVIFNFLQRNLLLGLYESLSPGGFLMMESILSMPEDSGRYRREFMLVPGELERLFEDFHGSIVQCTEAPGDRRARILFQKTIGSA